MQEVGLLGAIWAPMHHVMEITPIVPEVETSKPISIGLTCWRWEWSRPRAIVKLAQRTGVTLRLTERRHGLHRDIEGLVSGPNVDRFIGEFAKWG